MDGIFQPGRSVAEQREHIPFEVNDDQMSLIMGTQRNNVNAGAPDAVRTHVQPEVKAEENRYPAYRENRTEDDKIAESLRKLEEVTNRYVQSNVAAPSDNANPNNGRGEVIDDRGKAPDGFADLLRDISGTGSNNVIDSRQPGNAQDPNRQPVSPQGQSPEVMKTLIDARNKNITRLDVFARTNNVDLDFLIKKLDSTPIEVLADALLKYDRGRPANNPAGPAGGTPPQDIKRVPVTLGNYTPVRPASVGTPSGTRWTTEPNI